ncbi:hypothetical protein K493DRAFT_407163 [Basidiobolus meristosporus CBS 931.73]|uniref:Myb/SANT-like domain-containing protein n=1 Tax=Basidiobolus meristosporus CBS 931.73 TaxID=1314790 RepID=A0A1Y1YGA2_9FUNG|nr:hypothetical protein K493DRAFT_407163 [Basidiobolus meristosporus CBS 931.73]|eukprot:ORX96664.1 hypothetical protein K493DRAFT_407163 [Basidiobolus meristosporus CBS 931.73]
MSQRNKRPKFSNDETFFLLATLKDVLALYPTTTRNKDQVGWKVIHEMFTQKFPEKPATIDQLFKNLRSAVNAYRRSKPAHIQYDLPIEKPKYCDLVISIIENEPPERSSTEDSMDHGLVDKLVDQRLRFREEAEKQLAELQAAKRKVLDDGNLLDLPAAKQLKKDWQGRLMDLLERSQNLQHESLTIQKQYLKVTEESVRLQEECVEELKKESVRGNELLERLIDAFLKKLGLAPASYQPFVRSAAFGYKTTYATIKVATITAPQSPRPGRLCATSHYSWTKSNLNQFDETVDVG